MGRKIKDTSDPKLARSHKAGAEVTFVQPCLHDQLGEIMYAQPNFWVFNFRIAQKAFNRLLKYEQEILQLPIGKSNNRLIHNTKLIEKVYRAGFELVANIYIAFEHLSLIIISTVYREDRTKLSKLQDKELIEKISHILKNIFLKPDLIKNDGYVRLFSEYEPIRHAFNHPVNSNTYNGKDWDKIPLAWIMAGKYKNGFKPIAYFLVDLDKLWSQYQKDHQTTTKLSITRGIKSLHQCKKPKK